MNQPVNKLQALCYVVNICHLQQNLLFDQGFEDVHDLVALAPTDLLILLRYVVQNYVESAVHRGQCVFALQFVDLKEIKLNSTTRIIT